MLASWMIGMIVAINWEASGYHGCKGKLMSEKEGLTLLIDVICYNGDRYDYIAGVPIERLTQKQFDSWHRPQQRGK